MTGPYVGLRGIDLGGFDGGWCGRLLAGLGAAVVRIERPSDVSFAQAIGDPDRHFAAIDWLAGHAGKSVLKIDIEVQAGRKTLAEIARGADFVIESLAPGEMAGLGLGYEDLARANPAIVMTSITPYGQYGPRAQAAASELTLWAMGGAMALYGDADRAPLAFGTPQALAQAGAHAALGTAIALYNVRRDGTGDHVDVSVQDAVLRTHMPAPVRWAYGGELMPRLGNRMALSATVSQRLIWPCRDMQVTYAIWGGALGKWTQPLADHIVARGDGERIRGIDWLKINTYALSKSDLAEIEDVFARFFAQHSCAELIALSLERRFPISPINSARHVLDDEHLAARDFWEVHAEAGFDRPVCWPGAPYRLSLTPAVGRPADGTGAAPDWPARLPAVARRRSAHALEGLKILDFSQIFAGPWTSSYLGDFGAQVIKVESTAHPDPVRTHPPFWNDTQRPENSYMGLLGAGSKRSLALNLQISEGRDLALKLVEWADVVAESFSAGAAEKLGLGYADLKTRKPSIVMLSTTLEGRSGPRAQSVGFGTDIQGRAGLVDNTGWPDRGSVLPHNAYGDNAAPWLSGLAILAAIEHRDRTGQGQHIEMSMYEALLYFSTPTLLRHAFDGAMPPRRGNRADTAAPHGVFRCAGVDRWCAIAAIGDAQWQALCSVINRCDLAAEPALATLTGRQENEDRIEAAIAEWTQSRPAEDVMRRMLIEGVPAGIVQTMNDVMELDAHAIGRGVLNFIDKSGMGPILQYAPVPRLTRRPYSGGIPCGPGEHTEEICRELLGLSSGEISELIAKKVLC